MKKTITKILIASLAGFSGMAVYADEFADKYFSSQSAPLSKTDQRALDIDQNRQRITVAPVRAGDGSIRFTYGTDKPTIVCAVLQVCDVILQEGETINSIHIGDSARWMISPGITGSGVNETQHIIIKPMDVGLQTSMVVTTNRRTYHIALKSHRSEYMTSISFAYPEDINAQFALRQTARQREVDNNTIPGTGEYIGNLDFNYRIDGSASWKPVRVFNNGVKTVIDMPRAMSQADAPTLLVVRRDSGLFRSEEVEEVNYRIDTNSNRFIVDTVFEKAILITGVGRSQTRVTITRSTQP